MREKNKGGVPITMHTNIVPFITKNYFRPQNNAHANDAQPTTHRASVLFGVLPVACPFPPRRAALHEQHRRDRTGGESGHFATTCSEESKRL